MPFPKGLYKLSDSPAAVMGRLFQDRDTLILTCVNTDVIMIPYGCGVFADPVKRVGSNAENAIILPTGATSRFLGVLFETDTTEKRPGVNIDANGRICLPIAPTAPPSATNPLGAFVARGVIGVLVDQDVKTTDPVFCRYTAGTGNSIRGSFRKDDDTAKAVAITGVEFVADTKAGNIAPLWIK